MKIYLDNCCYYRIFDYKSSLLIIYEAGAVADIAKLIQSGHITCTYSFMSKYENMCNSDKYKRESINFFMETYCKIYVPYDENYIESKIAQLQNSYKLHYKDAAHLASAIKAGCDYFLTTDKRFMNNYKGSEIIIINPVDFLEKIKEV